MLYVSCFVNVYFACPLLSVFTRIGSGSPNNSDDDQKMNNFIEKGTVFSFNQHYFFCSFHPFIHLD